MVLIFQSTRPVRGATEYNPIENYDRMISIHAPRAGRDDLFAALGDTITNISIHAPRAGRDDWILHELKELETFQSTRPVRGATIS